MTTCFFSPTTGMRYFHVSVFCCRLNFFHSDIIANSFFFLHTHDHRLHFYNRPTLRYQVSIVRPRSVAVVDVIQKLENSTEVLRLSNRALYHYDSEDEDKNIANDTV